MKRITHAFPLYIVTLAASFLALYCTSPTRITGSGSETIYGRVVDQRSGAFAAGARISLFSSTDIDTVIIDTVRSDNSGRYEFNNLRQGAYRLLAASFDNNAVLLKQITYADSSKSLDIGTDTLKIPGALRAIIMGAGQVAPKVFCYLRGTPYFDVSDDSGALRMEKIPPGSYTLRVVAPETFATKDTVVFIESGKTTNTGVIVLTADPRYAPPQVQGLSAVFDTVRSLVRLSWDSVSVSDLAGYLVYRRSSNDSSFKEISSILPGITFVDSLKPDLLGREYSYIVRAIDSGGATSTLPSNRVSVMTLSDSLVRTRCIFSIINNTTDTFAIGDTVAIAVLFENPTRINSRLEWYVDSAGLPLRTVTLNTKSGGDTLVWIWMQQGSHTIIVRIVDGCADQWRDTMAITIKGDIVHHGTWRQLAPAPMSGPTYLCGTIGSRIYLVGRRYGPAIRTYSIFSFDTRSGLWDTVSDCPTNREGVGCALYHNAIFVAGGVELNGQISNVVEIFNRDSLAWSKGPPLPYPMQDLQLVTSNDQLYLLGGYDVTWYNWIYRCDSLRIWTPIFDAYMLSDRSDFAIAQKSDSIYSIGGLRSNSAIAAVEVFVPSLSQCNSVTPMRFSRSGAAAAVFMGNIFVFGGEASGRVIDTCEMYTPVQNLWISLPPMPTPRYNLAAAEVEGAIYLIGGIDGTGQSVSAVEMYIP